MMDTLKQLGSPMTCVIPPNQHHVCPSSKSRTGINLSMGIGRQWMGLGGSRKDSLKSEGRMNEKINRILIAWQETCDWSMKAYGKAIR